MSMDENGKRYTFAEGGKNYTIAEHSNGNKFWYLNNKLHRENGPAIEHKSGAKVWYFQGEEIKCTSQKEFENQIKIKKTGEIKKYFDVKVETMLPATLTYKVLAKDAEEASRLIKNMSPTGVQHKLAGKRDIKLTVYETGSMMIKFMKNLVGL